VQAAYVDGQLQACILDCPFAPVGEPCSVARHALRVRKTGPAHPLVIQCCCLHERYFTVYPLKFVPYGRRPIEDEPVEHEVLSVVEAIDTTAVDGPRVRGVTDAVAGSWSTQLRLVDLVSRMFGLGALNHSLHVSMAFGISLTDLQAAARTHGCRDRAIALQRLRDGLSMHDLLALGALMGCWGRPHRWDPTRDQLVALPLSRGPPTTLGHSVWAASG